jgi:hypothetical protein
MRNFCGIANDDRSIGTGGWDKIFSNFTTLVMMIAAVKDFHASFRQPGQFNSQHQKFNELHRRLVARKDVLARKLVRDPLSLSGFIKTKA